MLYEAECHQVIGAAIAVHRALGPGLLESIYSRCLCIELQALGIRVRRELPIPLVYRGMRIEPAYRIDLVVDDKIIIEVKCVARMDPIFKAQLLTYLKLTGLRVGYLLNFNAEVLRDGITRMVR